MEKEFVANYIKESMETYIKAFGTTDGFKEYISKKLNEKIGRFN